MFFNSWFCIGERWTIAIFF